MASVQPLKVYAAKELAARSRSSPLVCCPTQSTGDQGYIVTYATGTAALPPSPPPPPKKSPPPKPPSPPPPKPPAASTTPSSASSTIESVKSGQVGLFPRRHRKLAWLTSTLSLQHSYCHQQRFPVEKPCGGTVRKPSGVARTSQVQMNGVSMGGWLVLEDFLAPEMFKNASKVSPYRSPRIPAGYNANK